MHRCLYVQEIVELISQEGFYDFDEESRTAILALAQTCRTLYEPAANIIWHRIETLKPLLNCVSREIWDNSVNDSNDIIKPLQSSDMAKIRRLGNRVREFGYDHKTFEDLYIAEEFPIQNDIQLQHYQALSIACGFVPLLQNVLKIRLVDPSFIMLAHVNLFTNPQITVFQMIFPFMKTPRSFHFQMAGFVGSLRERYPSLEVLSIRLFPLKDDPLAVAVEGALCSCQWTKLSKLTVSSPCSTGVLNYLLECPSLRDIDVIISSEETALLPVNSRSVSSPYLPLLEDMTLLIPRILITLDFLHLLLPRPQPNPLHSVHLYSNNPEFATTEQWQDLMQCISKLCLNPNGPPSLTIFEVDDSLVYPDDIEVLAEAHRYTISLVDSPLFNFSTLTIVNIITFGIIELNDDVLESLARNWPYIQSLKLMGQHPLNLPPKATIKGLAVLADRCSSLAKLAIEFSAESSRASRPGPRPKFGRTLRVLDVGRSPLTKPTLTAAMLADLFPCLVTFRRGREHRDLWKQVEDLYPAFVQARSDEIMRSQVERESLLISLRSSS